MGSTNRRPGGGWATWAYTFGRTRFIAATGVQLRFPDRRLTASTGLQHLFAGQRPRLALGAAWTR